MEPRLGAITENIAFLDFLKQGGQSKTYPIPMRPRNSNEDIHSLTFKHEIVIGKAFAVILVKPMTRTRSGLSALKNVLITMAR
jgi:hypothetical protein